MSKNQFHEKNIQKIHDMSAKENIFHRQNNTPIKNKIIFSIFFPWHSFPPQLFFKEKKVIRIILCDDELFEFLKKIIWSLKNQLVALKNYEKIITY